jgi:choline trimethylamine-lyase
MRSVDGWIGSLASGVETLRSVKRGQTVNNAWFYVQETRMHEREAMRRAGLDTESAFGRADLLCRTVERMPLSIPAGSALAGSQDGAFSPSYALINPSFKVEEFAGYCDPCAAYNDIDAEEGLDADRVATVRAYWEGADYVRDLQAIYERFARYTAEVAFFMEPVTGHTIPDLRPYLEHGVLAMQERALASGTDYGRAMTRSLDAPLILARRYRALALELAAAAAAAPTADTEARARLEKIAVTLDRVPAHGARDLHEAAQAFVLLWQAMVIEQAPNPYAFSAGNLDRIFAPYRGDCGFEEAVGIIRHLLCFYQVGDRCWAISQNIMVGGRDEQGRDQTNSMTDVVLEAFFRSNDPQPSLSVKVHAGTPDALYLDLGRFFFTPGHSTPSLFNDDAVLPILASVGVADSDQPDYGIAGCQEPSIMGRSSLNTTNTWLNLGKVLEVALNDGKSTISGAQIGPTWAEMGFRGADDAFARAEQAFLATLDALLPDMAAAGNACTTLLGRAMPVPLTSSLMDSLSTFRDLRDPESPGVRYGGSGCLIHGLAVVADSITALGAALRTWTAEEIRAALASDFREAPRLQGFLAAQPKYANNDEGADATAIRIATAVSGRVNALRNAAGARYLADWSTPSTHLLYGYWVGATPDGRPARTMLSYGIDPRPESSRAELPERFLSFRKLPFGLMVGGYASHIGICPVDADFRLPIEGRARWMWERVIAPLFRFGEGVREAPYYVYFNIDTAEHLRAVLRDPKGLAPSGTYIMRIHGTFVNFLDLSPAIQEDIITRLEAGGFAA